MQKPAVQRPQATPRDHRPVHLIELALVLAVITLQALATLVLHLLALVLTLQADGTADYFLKNLRKSAAARDLPTPMAPPAQLPAGVCPEVSPGKATTITTEASVPVELLPQDHDPAMAAPQKPAARARHPKAAEPAADRAPFPPARRRKAARVSAGTAPTG